MSKMSKKLVKGQAGKSLQSASELSQSQFDHFEKCYQSQLQKNPYFEGIYPQRDQMSKIAKFHLADIKKGGSKLTKLKDQIQKYCKEKYPNAHFNWKRQSYIPKSGNKSAIKFYCKAQNYKCNAYLRYTYNQEDNLYHLTKYRNHHSHIPVGNRNMFMQGGNLDKQVECKTKTMNIIDLTQIKGENQKIEYSYKYKYDYSDISSQQLQIQSVTPSVKQPPKQKKLQEKVTTNSKPKEKKRIIVHYEDPDFV